MNNELTISLQEKLDNIITTSKLLDHKISKWVDYDILVRHSRTIKYQFRYKTMNIVLGISSEHNILKCIFIFDKTTSDEVIYSSYETKNHDEILQCCLNLLLQSE